MTATARQSQMMIRTAKSETKKVAVSILLLSHRDTLLFPPTSYPYHEKVDEVINQYEFRYWIALQALDNPVL